MKKWIVLAMMLVASAASAQVTNGCYVEVVVESSVVTNGTSPEAERLMRGLGGLVYYAPATNTFQMIGYSSGWDDCQKRINDAVAKATTYPKVNESRLYVWSNVVTRFMAQQHEISRTETNIYLGSIVRVETITQLLATNISERFEGVK